MKVLREKLIDSALSYAQQGKAVLPINWIDNGRCSCGTSSCSRPGKHPITRHGVKDATTNKKLIKKWWTDYPKANIGIATGKISGIIVLDIDPRNGGTESIKDLISKYGKLPKTVKAETGGGGVHYYFKYPKVGLKTSMGRSGDWAGIDIMSDGGYVVAPPSSHASGGKYNWINAPENTELRAIKKPWLVGIRNISKGKKGQNKSDMISHGSKGIQTGERNTVLTQLAGSLCHKGLSEAAILAALLEENKARCITPLDDSEVKNIAKSVSRYAADQEFAEIKDPSYRLAKTVLSERFGGGKYLKQSPDGQFWTYDHKGLWKILSDKELEGKVLEVIKAHSSEIHQKYSTIMKDVLHLLRAELATGDDVFRLRSKALPVVNCANGTVWFKADGSHEFKAHDSRNFLTTIIPVEYDPDAKCPRFKNAVLEIFENSKAPRSMLRHWFEIMGYILQPSRMRPMVIILYGTGANGKTVLYRILVELLGWDRVFSGSVVNLERDRFATGNLFGKLLFADDDVSEGIQLPDGTLKKISEEKLISGEKKYRDPIQFLNRAIPLLLCNNVPFIRDLSHGLQRRLMVIPFDRKFDASEQDLGLVDYLSSNELPGILNSAIAGFSRFMKRGGFRKPKPVIKAHQAWMEKANTLELFISEKCQKKRSGKINLSILYRAYERWAEQSGIKSPINRHTLKRNIEHLGFAVTRSNEGNQVKGLTLKK